MTPSPPPARRRLPDPGEEAEKRRLVSTIRPFGDVARLWGYRTNRRPEPAESEHSGSELVIHGDRMDRFQRITDPLMWPLEEVLREGSRASLLPASSSQYICNHWPDLTGNPIDDREAWERFIGILHSFLEDQDNKNKLLELRRKIEPLQALPQAYAIHRAIDAIVQIAYTPLSDADPQRMSQHMHLRDLDKSRLHCLGHERAWGSGAAASRDAATSPTASGSEKARTHEDDSGSEGRSVEDLVAEINQFMAAEERRVNRAVARPHFGDVSSSMHPGGR